MKQHWFLHSTHLSLGITPVLDLATEITTLGVWIIAPITTYKEQYLTKDTYLCTTFIYLHRNRTAPIHPNEYPSLCSKVLSPCNKNLSPHMYYQSLWKMMCSSIYQRMYPSLQTRYLSLRHKDLSPLNFKWLKPISEDNINSTLTMRRWQNSSPVCGLSWQQHFGTLLNCLSGHTD